MKIKLLLEDDNGNVVYQDEASSLESIEEDLYKLEIAIENLTDNEIKDIKENER